MKYVTLILLALFVGCATLGQMPSVDRAKVSCYYITTWYSQTVSNVKQIYDKGTPDEKAYLEKNVNPLLNKAKPIIVAYIDMVKLWQMTGDKPAGMDDLFTQLETLTKDIMDALQKGGM